MEEDVIACNIVINLGKLIDKNSKILKSGDKMDKFIQLTNITTSSANENIMTFLKTKTDLNGDTENKPFALKSVYFETDTNTKVKINSNTVESDLILDIVTNKYKLEISNYQVLIKSFIIATDSVNYNIKFTY